MSAAEALSLAMDHLIFAGLMAIIFTAVAVAYFIGMSRGGAGMNRQQFYLSNTAYVYWQSSIAFMAVMASHAAEQCLEHAGDAALALGWGFPIGLAVPTALLYGAVILLSLLWCRSCRQ
jgi:hypothetical protein